MIEDNNISKDKKWSTKKKVIVIAIISYIIIGVIVLSLIFTGNFYETSETVDKNLLKRTLKSYNFEEEYGKIIEIVRENDNYPSPEYEDELFYESNYVVHTEKGIDKNVFVKFWISKNTYWIVYMEMDGKVLVERN